MNKPFFSFYGGKWRAAPHYPKPLYDTIIEPFAGSAGYSVRHCDRKVILVEKDFKVAATWRYLLRASSSEILSLPDVELRQSTDGLSVCEEAKFLIGWWLHKGVTSPRKKPSVWMCGALEGKWPTVGKTSFWGDAIRRRIASQVSSIRHWTVIEGDYAQAPDVEATWFIDPPYQKAGKYYRCGSSAIDYTALAEWCRTRKGQVIVCESVGADWLPFVPWRDIKASEAKRGGKKSREAIWIKGETTDE